LIYLDFIPITKRFHALYRHSLTEKTLYKKMLIVKNFQSARKNIDLRHY